MVKNQNHIALAANKLLSDYSRFLRCVSYRGFTRMVYQFLGNKRIPLPACAYMAIRKTFPVTEKEAFTGYVDESD